MNQISKFPHNAQLIPNTVDKQFYSVQLLTGFQWKEIAEMEQIHFGLEHNWLRQI